MRIEVFPQSQYRLRAVGVLKMTRKRAAILGNIVMGQHFYDIKMNMFTAKYNSIIASCTELMSMY